MLRPPPHLRGKEIGLWYARQSKLKAKKFAASVEVCSVLFVYVFIFSLIIVDDCILMLPQASSQGGLLVLITLQSVFGTFL